LKGRLGKKYRQAAHLFFTLFVNNRFSKNWLFGGSNIPLPSVCSMNKSRICWDDAEMKSGLIAL